MTDPKDLISRKAVLAAPSTDDPLATMISDLSHTGELSMLYRMSIADAITELRAENARLRALPSVGVPETGEGKIGDRLDAAQWSAITAHFSYECEPRTTLPNWNTVAMEAIRLSNELREAKGRLAALDVQPAPDAAQVRADALRLGYSLGFRASGEGWNAEYMTGSRGETIEENEDWVATRDETLAAMITTPAPSPDVAQVRAEALEDAAKACDRIAGNTADFPRDHRRAAGQCAAMIRALIDTAALEKWEAGK